MPELIRRLRVLLRPRQWRRDLADEMRLHQELRSDPRRFGNDLRLLEASRDAWGWSWLESFGQDLRHGLRLLARTPVATALALASLTLGLGANTALFSLTNAVLLRSLPVPHPEQLVQVLSQFPGEAKPTTGVANPLWEALRDDFSGFAASAAWADFNFDLGTQGDAMLPGAFVSGDFFNTLGVQPQRGRLLAPSDDFHACPALADISDAFWHSHFLAASTAIGATLNLAGHAVTVIGVMPSSFFGAEVGRRADVAVPLCAEPVFRSHSLLAEPNSWWLSVIARLPAGGSLTPASARLNAMRPQWSPALPAEYTTAERAQFRFVLQPGGLGLSYLRSAYGLPLETLLAVAGFVLLVACANLAGLMLARAAARRQELAIRLALGASRSRLLRQLLAETFLLALAGTAGGALFALWACRATASFFSYPKSPVMLALSPDARVFAFTAALALATTLLVGLYPALRATRTARAPRPLSAPPPLGSGWIVAVQLALALVLIAGASLFLRSFIVLTGAGKGFNTHGIVLVTATAPTGHPLPAGLAPALRALPGVTSLSASLLVPAQGSSLGAEIETVSAAGPSTLIHSVYANLVAPGFFATLRTPLLRGRDFAATDTASAPAVAIVNQSLARELFPSGGVLGGRIRQLVYQGPPSPPAVIIGVVADAKYYHLNAAAPPTAYFPLAQTTPPPRIGTFYLDSALPATVLTPEVRAVFARFAPTANLRVETFDALLEDAVKPQRMLASLSECFGGLALLLAAIGLYGALAYESARRRREFGVRVALGARPAAIRRLVLRQAAARIVLGVVAGLLTAVLAARAAQAALGKLLYGVAPTDPVTLAAAAALLIAASLAAAWLPARRASRADPMLALREE